MFGNSKEYQDMQKLYAEKVSKPENIKEFFGLGKKNKKVETVPLTGKDREDINKEQDAEKLQQSIKSGEFKKLGAEIEKKKAEANKKEVEFRLKNTESSEQSAKAEKPEPTYKSRVTGADRAKALAKARIKSGKTIEDVKKSNLQSMRDRARARNDAFKAKRASRNLDKKLDFDDPAKGGFGLSNSRGKSVKKLGKPQPKVKSPMDMRGESYNPETIEERLGGKGVSKKAAAGSIYPGEKGDGQTEDQDRGEGNKAKRRAGEPVEKKSPTFIAYIKNKKEDKKKDDKMEAYDIVLEYLLTSQQAATIEEANYIMTEMDAKTIQDIVSQQLNEQN